MFGFIFASRIYLHSYSQIFTTKRDERVKNLESHLIIAYGRLVHKQPRLCCVDPVSHISPDSMKVRCTRVEENKSIVPSRTRFMYFLIQSLPQLWVIVYDHPPMHLDGHQLTE